MNDYATTGSMNGHPVMSEYINGFNAGYAYVLDEIERYIETYPSREFVLSKLLAHLKMENKQH